MNYNLVSLEEPKFRLLIRLITIFLCATSVSCNGDRLGSHRDDTIHHLSRVGSVLSNATYARIESLHSIEDVIKLIAELSPDFGGSLEENQIDSNGKPYTFQRDVTDGRVTIVIGAASVSQKNETLGIRISAHPSEPTQVVHLWRE